MRTVFAEGQDTNDRRNGRLTALFRVSPGYFETIRIPLVRGRSFAERDGPDAPMVAVINETMARRLWPGEDAIGRRFRCFGEKWIIEVVGIVRDAKYQTLGEEPQSFMYFPLLQHYAPAVTLHLRTDGDPSPMVGILRDQVQALDKMLPIVGVNTISQVMETVLWAPRMGAILLAVFGVMALLLAAIGIHGVMSYSVVQRTREIGIRMAMGASSRDVLRLVLGQALLILLIGGLTGLAGAFAVFRVLSSLLYGIGGGDPLAFMGTTFVLVVVALLASYIPARRATRVEPGITLQYE
jgi:putative ABC transport system permease protein